MTAVRQPAVAPADPPPFMVVELERILSRRSALALPRPLQERLRALELPEATLEDALGSIWTFSDWTGIWSRHGQQWYYQARRDEGEGKWRRAAIARRHAAMCYLAADFAALDDGRTGAMLRSTAARFFAQALPHLYQHAFRVLIPWRDRQVPAYLRLPAGVAQGDMPPVLIAFGSASTIKEEVVMLTSSFVDAGWAVLAVDWPGTGEMSGMRLDAKLERLVEATLREVRLDPRLDGSRIALLGLGLGGAPVVRAAGVDPAIGAVVVVSPPFDPTRWPHHAGALAASPFPDDAQGRELAGSFALGEAIEGLTTPLLVFGGGYDQVAPPAEAERVACAAGEWATLVWYPTGGHLLWEARDDWPLVATAWLATLFAADQEAGDVEETPEGSGDTTDGTAGAGRAGAVGWGDHAPPEWSGLGPGEVGDVDETDGDAWADDLAWGTPAGAPPREPFSD